MDLNETQLLKLAVVTYMNGRKIMSYLALLMLFLGVVACGIEPMQYPWVRVGLAVVLLFAYIATLMHCRDPKPKD
jgi:uncharacterized membrane protein